MTAQQANELGFRAPKLIATGFSTEEVGGVLAGLKGQGGDSAKVTNPNPNPNQPKP